MWASLSSCSLKRHSCGCITLLPPAWQGTQLSSWSPARILCSTHPCTMCDSQQPLLCGPWLITSNALQLLWNLQVWPRPSDPGLCCPVPRHLGWTLLDVSSCHDFPSYEAVCSICLRHALMMLTGSCRNGMIGWSGCPEVGAIGFTPSSVRSSLWSDWLMETFVPMRSSSLHLPCFAPPPSGASLDLIRVLCPCSNEHQVSAGLARSPGSIDGCVPLPQDQHCHLHAAPVRTKSVRNTSVHCCDPHPRPPHYTLRNR